MSKIKKAVIFDEPSHEDKDANPELTAQMQFSQQETQFSAPVAEQETEAESELTSVVNPPKKSRLGLKALMFAGAGLIGWQLVDHVYSAWMSSDWLSLGWSGFIGGISLFGAAALGREWLALRKLRQRQDDREKVQAIIDADGIGKARPICQSLAESSESKLTPGYDRWNNALAETHNDREVFELYDLMVVAEQDKAAKKAVTRYASESAVMVAVSPLAVVDMLLVAWRNFKLLESIANIYGVKLGYWSRIRLLRLVIANMAAAGVTEAVTDVSIDLISVDLAGRMATRAAQGIGVGLLTARLGYKAMALMRPLPYISESPPKLSELRKQLIGKLLPGKKKE
ncbi:YcjF family protein [Veronia pacifica]|uniref:TIGR01620 family protein n=1 Tax=Veronia pacifica TaxID=1080227 RepID=A0A1C3EM70_9GAMM|nr:TIGR01620 family protein [Veronia pacifica]ODA34319.1 TIGR01620 family protein [Veronia pacifica]